jgi:DivIVA domain-containing protein
MAEPLHADQIASRDFSTSFRGFDQHEVRSFLAHVATELATAHERERALAERVAQLEAAPPAALDEAALEQALGQEATRVIHAAREAASEIRERAEANAAKILQEANERNATARADADALGATVRREAEEQAARIVEEAEATRDRVLKELQRRRKQALAQLEQLHEARARLEGAYEHVRATLDAATAEVAIADDEAVAIAAAAVAPAAPSADATPAPEPEPEPEADAEPPAEELADEPAPEVVEEPPVAAVVVESPQQAQAHDDDRRSSSLRVVRNPEPPEPLQPLEPLSYDDFEGVRIIRPEPAAAAPEPEPAAAAVPDAAADDDVPVAASEPEPADEPEAVAPVPSPEAEPEPERRPAEAEVEAEAEPTVAAEPAPVEDLFARLRADRAEKTAAAVAVLADPVVDAADADVEVLAEVEAEPSGDAALLAARDAAIAEIERNLVRSVKRALADEQNEVLDALRRLKGRPTVEVIMPDAAVHEARYEAVLASAALASAGAGGTGDGAAVALERGRGVAVDLRGRIQRALDDAGGDVETLIDAISATYREWKSSRTEALARDVVTAAYAHGAYDATGGELRWVVDPAEGGCPDCDDNALAGATPKGTAFPTGQLHPPAHAGCRCIVVAATT